MAKGTYNLSALADRLSSENRLKPLYGKIRRARDVASIHTDLTIALESVDALLALITTDEVMAFDKAITEFALMCNAVVHYARATKTTSKERAGYDLRSRLDADQKIVHQELIDLRDHAIAHFGSGGSYTGSWHLEIMILQAADSGVRPGVATRRLTRDKSLVVRAKKQIEAAQALMSEIGEKKIQEVTSELNKLDPDLFEEEISQHAVDLDELMLSKDVGEQIRSSANAGGYRKGYVEHKKNS